MNTYTEIEDSIVERLSALAVPNSIEVVPMPESEAEFDRNTANRVRITVEASSMKGDVVKDTRLVSQEAPITVAIIIQANRRRGDLGIFTLEKAVRLRLLGFRPTNTLRGLKYINGGFVNAEWSKSVWTYQIELEALGVVHEEYDEDAGTVLITQITHSSELTGEDYVTVNDEIDGGDASDVGYELEIDGNV